MAPAVTIPDKSETSLASDLGKVNIKDQQAGAKVFNPFYSPSIGDDGDNSYQFSKYKVCICHQPLTVFKKKKKVTLAFSSMT